MEQVESKQGEANGETANLRASQIKQMESSKIREPLHCSKWRQIGERANWRASKLESQKIGEPEDWRAGKLYGQSIISHMHKWRASQMGRIK